MSPIITLNDNFYIDTSKQDRWTLYNGGNLVSTYVILNDAIKRQAMRDIAFRIKTTFNEVLEKINNPPSDESSEESSVEINSKSNELRMAEYIYNLIPPQSLNRIKSMVDDEEDVISIVMTYLNGISNTSKGEDVRMDENR